MNGLKIGDRVRVVSESKTINTPKNKIINGMIGTVKDQRGERAGIEFDDYIGGHNGIWNGKDGHCWYVDNKYLEKIEESEVKEMNDLKIGDRVRIISDPKFTEFAGEKSIIGMTGTAKDLKETCVGVEFDVCIGGHSGSWNGEPGYCWYIQYKHLEKIEETEEETKAEMLEQKILEALREEIGVEIGEEFEVYENGEKQWTCKFEENGFFDETNGKFRETGLWKNIIRNFQCFKFKRKPFMPRYSEEYFYFTGNLGNEYLPISVELRRWVDGVFDYGMLALGNVFRTREEAIKSEDKLLERLEKLRKGE